MKKKALAILLCTVTAISMIGCGSKNDSVESTESVENTESTEVALLPIIDLTKYDLNAEDYVTLCDYSAIPVTITGTYDVTDDDVTTYFTQMFEYYAPYYTEDTSKTTIGEGDIVNVDYVGKLDGVAFDNGSAEDQTIDVSNNASTDGTTFIDGFTTGLMGASVGDTVDCNVTFPENYQPTDLAGKDVVFTFTVNSIQKEVTIDDVDDAFVSEQFQVETVDEMNTQIRSFLQSSADSAKSSDTYTAIQNYMLDNCTVDIPADYFADRLTAFENMFINTYCGGDTSQLESYLSTNYGYTVEQAEAEWNDTMKQNIELEFIMEAVAKAEGLELDEEGFSTYVTNLVSYNGFGSEEDLYTNYGYGDPAYGEVYMRTIYTANLALDLIKENAVVTISAADDAEAVETTEAE